MTLPTAADLKVALHQILQQIGPEGSWVTLVVYHSGRVSFRFGDPLIVDSYCYGKERVTHGSDAAGVASRLLSAAKVFTPVSGTPDYESATQYVTYKRTLKGHAMYWIHPKSIRPSKRTQINAVAVGGLP
jgi:hypothetical protein